VLTVAIIGLALFAALAAGVLALMAARTAAVRVLILACVLAVAGAGMAVVGDRVYSSCVRDANASGGTPGGLSGIGGPNGEPSAQEAALTACDKSHAFGLHDPF
jgi:hypothetical protein